MWSRYIHSEMAMERLIPNWKAGDMEWFSKHRQQAFGPENLTLIPFIMTTDIASFVLHNYVDRHRKRCHNFP